MAMDETQSARFAAIKRMYSTTDVADYTPYPIDWLPMFTPIEGAMWGSIRSYGGLPFWPQFPIGPYFADFADPIKKLVIECDGAKFHQDKERDRQRDSFMAADGWTVFRISGADCMRVLPSPAELQEDEDWELDGKATDTIRRWYLKTSDGLISSIAERFYGAKPQFREIGDLSTEDLINEIIANRMAA